MWKQNSITASDQIVKSSAGTHVSGSPLHSWNAEQKVASRYQHTSARKPIETPVIPYTLIVDSSPFE